MPRSLTMNTSTVVILLVLALIVFLAILKRRGRLAAGGSRPWPFYVKRLLSQPEQVLYHRLVKSLPNHVVLAQVQMSRVLGVKKGFRFHEWNNRINRMSYDFVICDKATTDAGLRLVRWHVKSPPDELTIQRELSANDASLGGALPNIYVERRE